jgi:hypothetical protein
MLQFLLDPTGKETVEAQQDERTRRHARGETEFFGPLRPQLPIQLEEDGSALVLLITYA